MLVHQRLSGPCAVAISVLGISCQASSTERNVPARESFALLRLRQSVSTARLRFGTRERLATTFPSRPLARGLREASDSAVTSECRCSAHHGRGHPQYFLI